MRDTVEKPSREEITRADLSELTELEAIGRGIADLSGIEHCPGLTYLALDTNQISDLSPLASLSSLAELFLHDNQISDISPLASLSGLTWLHLGVNQISDLSPLASRSSLFLLTLHDNNLDLSEGSEDLENIRRLQSGESLWTSRQGGVVVRSSCQQRGRLTNPHLSS